MLFAVSVCDKKKERVVLFGCWFCFGIVVGDSSLVLHLHNILIQFVRGMVVKFCRFCAMSRNLLEVCLWILCVYLGKSIALHTCAKHFHYDQPLTVICL
jgi:hypothetical protein